MPTTRSISNPHANYLTWVGPLEMRRYGLSVAQICEPFWILLVVRTSTMEVRASRVERRTSIELHLPHTAIAISAPAAVSTPALHVGMTIATVCVMSLRNTFANEVVAIAAMSTTLAIVAAWYFERSGPDYTFLRQLEEAQKTRNMGAQAERPMHPRENAPPLRARDSYAQR